MLHSVREVFPNTLFGNYSMWMRMYNNRGWNVKNVVVTNTPLVLVGNSLKLAQGMIRAFQMSKEVLKQKERANREQIFDGQIVVET